MPARRIPLRDLLDAIDRKPRYLWDLRERGLFPFEPDHSHPAGLRGSASDYPAEALDYLRRLAEVQERFPRSTDECIWQMWLDPARWPIDMRAWVLRRLDRLLDITMRAGAESMAPNPGAERDILGGRRMRNPRSRRTALDWMAAWALGNERPDLYSATPEGIAEPSGFDLLLKLAGPLFEGMAVPRFGGQRERISERGGPYLLAHFRRIVALAPDRHMEQARRDFRCISNLIDGAERVDWNKVPDFVGAEGKAEPPSWAARKARRARRKPPPDFIKEPIEAWRREFDSRALLFSTLLTARRLLSRTSAARLPDYMLGIAQLWLVSQPRIATTPDAPPSGSGHGI